MMTTVVEDEDQEKSCDVHKKRKTGSILFIDRVSPSGYRCVSGSLPKKKKGKICGSTRTFVATSAADQILLVERKET